MVKICLLYTSFENNENDAILKTKERLVKVFMEKYKEMQKNEKLWSTAMAIQMGEARYRNGLNDSYKEGLEKGLEQGLEQGERLLLKRQIEKKYHEDATEWLKTLTSEHVSNSYGSYATVHSNYSRGLALYQGRYADERCFTCLLYTSPVWTSASDGFWKPLSGIWTGSGRPSLTVSRIMKLPGSLPGKQWCC